MANEFLSDREQDLVRNFYENEGMREAVKKVLLAALYDNGTLAEGKPADALKNFALTYVHGTPSATDEQIGRRLRAQYEGIMKVEEAFSHMSTYKKVVKRQNQSQ